MTLLDFMWVNYEYDLNVANGKTLVCAVILYVYIIYIIIPNVIYSTV